MCAPCRPRAGCVAGTNDRSLGAALQIGGTASSSEDFGVVVVNNVRAAMPQRVRIADNMLPVALSRRLRLMATSAPGITLQ